MAIDPLEIARLDALLEAVGAEAEWTMLDAALARLLPGIARRHCDASDVLEDPFRSHASADFHLLDTSGHCIRVTAEPQEATALLIAAKMAQVA